jgi:internalin A
MTNINNTKSVIQPDQLRILQELSKLLNTSLKEVRSFDIFQYHYSGSVIVYYLSRDGGVIGLKIYNKNISDLEMNLICQLEDLVNLSLYDNQIKNTRFLSRLTNLAYLDLNHNQIQDISSFSRLTNLTYLYMIANQIQDISPLSRLASLKYISLYSNQIQDISSFSESINLTNLFLSNNQIQNISPLSELKNLKILYIQNNNLRYLKYPKKLTYCDLPNWKKEKKYFKRLSLF